MEPFHYGFGYILYSIQLSQFLSEQTLELDQVQDRALVYLDGVLQGVLGWTEPDSPNSMTLVPNSNPNPQLNVLKEEKERMIKFFTEILGLGPKISVKN